MPPVTIRLDLAYIGRDFSGWAVQPGLRTVQGELEEALGKVLGTPPVLTVAGRTDAGVHAARQVASFRAELQEVDWLLPALNALTGPDVAVLAVTRAPDAFDARRLALSRNYLYRVLWSRVPSPFERESALFWPHPLDEELLVACAEATIGTHDFTAFTPTETDHVRFDRDVLDCGWLRGTPPPGDHPGVLLEMRIEADAFMRNMVRILVGTMLQVGSGRRSLEDYVALLEGAPRKRAGPTAAPHGLHLMSVNYG